ncbi:DUF3560 domain-containing protein [Actinokineospora terrae]|uniref:DUF3560 domain-containing protein n=1 Tax=Actinokineospora terrae TaxID=155974 RepID=A0A1H9M835_9PSEU|nr:DUF3560 domain-containing protein [Actinokineospora terrae]SER19848.1 protein of unknown function [Actinokineospora terrae]
MFTTTATPTPNATAPGIPAPAVQDPAPVRELEITHTPEDGTVLEGITRADDAYDMLRGLGWLARKDGSYVLQASKHKPAKRYRIKETAEALREQYGVAVRVELERGFTAPEEAEYDLAAAAELRASRLERRAVRLDTLSKAAHDAAVRVFDAIPFGQPALPGHHSYKADRRRRDRAWAQLGRSYELGREAEQTQAAAETAGKRMTHRHNPVTVANRIDRFEAEGRGLLRTIKRDDAARKLPEEARIRLGLRLLSDDYREDIAELYAHNQGQIAYWTEFRQAQLSTGEAVDYSQEVKPGDFVRVRGQWHYVVRANKKTVSVPNWLGLSCTDTSPWQEVQAHVPAGHERHTPMLTGFLRGEVKKAQYADDHKFVTHARKLFPDLAAQALDPATGPVAESAGETSAPEAPEVDDHQAEQHRTDTDGAPAAGARRVTLELGQGHGRATVDARTDAATGATVYTVVRARAMSGCVTLRPVSVRAATTSGPPLVAVVLGDATRGRFDLPEDCRADGAALIVHGIELVGILSEVSAESVAQAGQDGNPPRYRFGRYIDHDRHGAAPGATRERASALVRALVRHWHDQQHQTTAPDEGHQVDVLDLIHDPHDVEAAARVAGPHLDPRPGEALVSLWCYDPATAYYVPAREVPRGWVFRGEVARVAVALLNRAHHDDLTEIYARWAGNTVVWTWSRRPERMHPDARGTYRLGERGTWLAKPAEATPAPGAVDGGEHQADEQRPALVPDAAESESELLTLF